MEGDGRICRRSLALGLELEATAGSAVLCAPGHGSNGGRGGVMYRPPEVPRFRRSS